MNIQTEEELDKAYSLIEEGKTSEAKQILAEALEYNFDSEELKFALWCCSYWNDFIRRLPGLEKYEQGESLINRWKTFKIDVDRQKMIFPKAVYAVQKGVFTLAFNVYKTFLDDKDSFGLTSLQKSEISRKLGLCYKKLGKYEDALNCLADANLRQPSSADILSEMADCFALCGEDKKAKVLFREAFFIDAQKVEIEFLDSELICSLIEQVKAKGYTGAALKEWIPVFGVLYGVFNMKRELKSHEAARLRQEIYAKENELKNPANNEDVLIPKLINMYFWLIDYYVRSGEGAGRINECLLQIRVHNESIYKMYTR